MFLGTPGRGGDLAALVVLQPWAFCHRGGGVDFRRTAHRYEKGAYGLKRKRRYDRRRAIGALAGEGR